MDFPGFSPVNSHPFLGSAIPVWSTPQVTWKPLCSGDSSKHPPPLRRFSVTTTVGLWHTVTYCDDIYIYTYYIHIIYIYMNLLCSCKKSKWGKSAERSIFDRFATEQPAHGDDPSWFMAGPPRKPAGRQPTWQSTSSASAKGPGAGSGNTHLLDQLYPIISTHGTVKIKFMTQCFAIFMA